VERRHREPDPAELPGLDVLVGGLWRASTFETTAPAPTVRPSPRTTPVARPSSTLIFVTWVFSASSPPDRSTEAANASARRWKLPRQYAGPFRSVDMRSAAKVTNERLAGETPAYGHIAPSSA
jgi:hypothetical protein